MECQLCYEPSNVWMDFAAAGKLTVVIQISRDEDTLNIWITLRCKCRVPLMSLQQH